ncbi:MAG: type II toxin-antitoxin system RelE family toxin [Thiotrichales bacterium]
MEKFSAANTKAIKKKLEECKGHSHNPASQLRRFKSVYKVKLHSVGYRLVYEVNDKEIVIYVITVGKRDRGLIYTKADQRAR